MTSDIFRTIVEKWFDGWSLSDKIAVIASAVAFLQFLALIATVFVMRRTAQRQLRAYAHIDDVVMSEMNSVNDPNIQIIVKNYGQTPARCITNTFKHCVLQLPQKPDFSLGGGQVEELCDLAPTQKTFSTFRYPHPQWQFFKDPISKKAMIFYVFGRISYRDVFGRRRKTEYRFRLLVDSTGIKDESSLVINGRSGNVTT
jgi:hypothetical protein